jgi:hypothetical protein
MGLFTPAWKSKNDEKALRAVEMITDQNKLYRIAKEADNRKVCQVAIEKLNDQSLLADIAKNINPRLGEAAVKKLTSQSVLADVAKNAKDKDIRKIAVGILTDQTVLADVAENDENSDVRKEAVWNLTDQAILAKIAFNNSDQEVCLVALEKITDQKILIAPSFQEQLINIFLNTNTYSVSIIGKLIALAKENPQIIKIHWQEIQSKLLKEHSDSFAHTDTRYNHTDSKTPIYKNTPYGRMPATNYSDCHSDSNVTQHKDTGGHSDRKHTDYYPLKGYLKQFPAFIDDNTNH